MVPGMPICVARGAGLLLLGMLACWPIGMQAQDRADLGFTTSLSQRAARAYATRFGAYALEQFEDWKAFARTRKSEPERELALLNRVNDLFNLIRSVEDIRHWGVVDYWATPAETVASEGADCEDFSIAKYYMLKELGVPPSRLRLTYVRALRLDQAHMVLAYYARPEGDPLVLDSLDRDVRPASERTDLVPVYSFNDDEIWLSAGGRAGSPRRIRRWAELLARLVDETR